MLISCSAPALAATINGIGFLPSGSFSDVAAVTDDGAFAAGHGFTVTGTRGLRWTAATDSLVETPTFSSASGRSSFARDVSNDGLVVVGSRKFSSSSNSTPVIYTAASPTGPFTITDLGGSFGLSRGVSDDGSVVVGNRSGFAFRWTQATGPVSLGDLPGGTNASIAHDVSGDGLVIVGHGFSSLSGSNTEAFRHQGGTMVGLGDLPGATFDSEARAVSPEGNVVAGFGTQRQQELFPGFFAQMREATIWQGNNIRALGILGPGSSASSTFSEALDVSASGQFVVGRSTLDGTFNTTAFIWDAANGMRDLKAAMQTDYGLDFTGWTSLTSANSISADGTVIGGTGVNSLGQTEGFVIDLGALAPVPANFLAQMVSGSQVILSQTVDTPADPTFLSFDYQFTTTTGDLTVLLDGMTLGTIAAPATLAGDLQSTAFSVDGLLLNLLNVELEFILNGVTGSTMLLDNVTLGGSSLVNGNFQTGSLTGWQTQTTGTGSIGIVPEPSAFALAAISLLALGFFGGRLRKRA